MSPKIGRYTDAFRPKSIVDVWNKSVEHFEKKNYNESFIEFFNYMKTPEGDNIEVTGSGSGLTFKLYQGSKLISGKVDEKRISAESELVSYEKVSVAVMRRLMEMNYSLYYSRFAINNNKILIKFDSSIIDCSPGKLYYALKELATRADKQDDLLLDDFSTLKPVNMHVVVLPAVEKEIKYRYLQKWINDVFKRISELNRDTYMNAFSYMYLNTAYKIDYLVSPEGTLMNDIEALSYKYFLNDGKTTADKNTGMSEALTKILLKTKEQVLEDLYDVKSTFGITNPTAHQAMVDLFNNNLPNAKQYIDSKKDDIAVNIFEYVAGYCLFSYGLPKPSRELFALVMQILNTDYYSELGFNQKLYDPSANKFDEQLIKDKINEIIRASTADYPELRFNIENIKFDSLHGFLRTYYAEMKILNYNT